MVRMVHVTSGRGPDNFRMRVVGVVHHDARPGRRLGLPALVREVLGARALTVDEVVDGMAALGTPDVDRESVRRTCCATWPALGRCAGYPASTTPGADNRPGTGKRHLVPIVARTFARKRRSHDHATIPHAAQGRGPELPSAGGGPHPGRIATTNPASWPSSWYASPSVN